MCSSLDRSFKKGYKSKDEIERKTTINLYYSLCYFPLRHWTPFFIVSSIFKTNINGESSYVWMNVALLLRKFDFIMYAINLSIYQ